MTSILSGHRPSYFNVNTSHLSQICVPFSKTLQHCLHLQNFIPCSLGRICSHHSCGHPVLAADILAPPSPPNHLPFQDQNTLFLFIYPAAVSVVSGSLHCNVDGHRTHDMWKILKTAILVVTNIHTINKCICWPLAHLKTTGPGDGTNDVGGWYKILAQTRAAFARGQGEEAGLEIEAIPGLPPRWFLALHRNTQGRDVALRYHSFAVSLPYVLLFEMKGNAVSNVSRWNRKAVEEQEASGMQGKAEPGMSLIFFCLLISSSLSRHWLWRFFPNLSPTRTEVKPQSALFSHSTL